MQGKTPSPPKKKKNPTLKLHICKCTKPFKLFTANFVALLKEFLIRIGSFWL